MQLIKSINYKYNIILNAKSLTTAGIERNQKRILVPVYNPIFIYQTYRKLLYWN